MRHIVWTATARRDLDSIVDYLLEKKPHLAEKTVAVFKRDVAALAKMPTGRPGRVGATYEKVMTRMPYIIVYALESDALIVLHLIHTARDWPQGNFPQ